MSKLFIWILENKDVKHSRLKSHMSKSPWELTYEELANTY